MDFDCRRSAKIKPVYARKGESCSTRCVQRRRLVRRRQRLAKFYSHMSRSCDFAISASRKGREGEHIDHARETKPQTPNRSATTPQPWRRRRCGSPWRAWCRDLGSGVDRRCWRLSFYRTRPYRAPPRAAAAALLGGLLKRGTESKRGGRSLGRRQAKWARRPSHQTWCMPRVPRVANGGR